MSDINSKILIQINTLLSELNISLNTITGNIKEVHFLQQLETLQLKLKYPVGMRENSAEIELADQGGTELIKLLDEIDKFIESIKLSLQTRFHFFQYDTQIRTQINMTIDSFELKAIAELDNWFKKLFSHFNTIVNRIDLDIQKQGSLSIRINRILKRLMFGTVNENVLPISVRQCIDLLQSLSHNESYISGTKQLTEAINQMANAPYEKLLILNDLEPLAVNSTSAPYKSRNTIITELEDHYKLMLENYFEPGLSTDANESELEIHVVHAERNLNKYLNNYVEFSIRYIISRVNEDLSVFIDRDKFNYTKTLESFREVTITARKALKKELWSKLSDYIQLIKTRINTNFNTFDKMLETEQKEIEFLYKNINNIDRSLTELSHILINKS